MPPDSRGFYPFSNPPILGASPAFGDLDGEGDEDLLLGDLEGRLHFFRNDAGPGNPAIFTLVAPAFQGLDVGQSAAPQIVDVNGDGLPDLLAGERAGNLNYFENTGTASVPNFSGGANEAFGAVDVSPSCCGGLSIPFLFRNAQGAWELLVGSQDGGIFHYGNIEGNLQGSFTLLSETFGDIDEGVNTAPWGGDLDGDGQWEWLIGNGRGGMAIYSMIDSLNTRLKPQDLPAKIAFFPNPATHPVLSLPRSHTTNLHIRVNDLYGRRVAHAVQELGDGQWQLSSDAAPGLYLVQILISGNALPPIKWLKP